MKTILLKMAGPLQSWGTGSHFESRKTDRYPSKSAVIGLIAASFGYRRDADEEIAQLNELDFAVRIDQPGRLLRDYHTAAKYKPNGSFERTYVTNRYYLEDAVFVAALGHKDEDFMNRIQDALHHPYFQPFLGRRSLPLPADFFLGVTTESVIDSLCKVPWQASKWFQKGKQPRLDLYCDAELIPSAPQMVRQDRVLSFSQRERKLTFRIEGHSELVLADPETVEDHDAFSVVGG